VLSKTLGAYRHPASASTEGGLASSGLA
jgi:hypothetical protein